MTLIFAVWKGATKCHQVGNNNFVDDCLLPLVVVVVAFFYGAPCPGSAMAGASQPATMSHAACQLEPHATRFVSG